MEISYNWLKRYIDFDLTPRELAAALTSLGLECDTVEEVESIRGGLRGVVIGRVLTCTDHPDSDHLHITTCDLGGDAPVQIVCGAPNVAAGQTVAVATVGCTLYDGDKEVKIKKSKIRGVESYGMICAEDELGLGTAHDGIMVLAPDAKPGTPAAEYFKVESDWRLEVELTPNRVDAASHYGVARDLRAWIARQNFDVLPDTPLPAIRVPDVSAFRPDVMYGATDVKVTDTEGCPRYSGVTVRGVKTGPSPEWLQKLLIAAGQRPINNIVDITNFVLLGIGQPLHCFDLRKVRGGVIDVRTCPAGTPFVTLDGVEHKLDTADLMVCDAEGPMAIAGVFGGLDSGVTDTTTDVFIESAYFNPTRVRKTARRHGLSTDASFRYERGTDPEITVYAAMLAALLIKEVAGGEICGEVVDVNHAALEPFPVTLSLDYAARLIGKHIAPELIDVILRALDIRILPTGSSHTLELRVPRYRVDVTRPCDVVEEILRVYGYNNVEAPAASRNVLSQKGASDFAAEMQNVISEQLTAQGFHEIMNNSLSAVSYYRDNAVWPVGECVTVLNPLSQDLSVMRRTLLYGGLESAARNINRKAPSIRFYEFGNVYALDPSVKPNAEAPLAAYTEERRLGIWMSGPAAADSWHTPGRDMSVFDLKAVVLGIFCRLGIDSRTFVMEQRADDVFSACLDIKDRRGRLLGTLGILSADTLRALDLKADVYYAELRMDPIYEMAEGHKPQFSPLPKTQPVRRDLALLINEATTYADIEKAIRAAEKKLLRRVFLFDVYQGKNLPEGKKSYAVGMILQDTERTLTDHQIDSAMQRIITSLKKIDGLELR